MPRWQARPQARRGSGCVCVPKNLGAIPQAMALEDAQHLRLKPGHEQKGQQEGGALSWRAQEVQLTPTAHPESHVPLGDVLPSFALSALALLS